jgi:hypothetical protein
MMLGGPCPLFDCLLGEVPPLGGAAAYLGLKHDEVMAELVDRRGLFDLALAVAILVRTPGR